jgi:hypothetical protein
MADQITMSGVLASLVPVAAGAALTLGIQWITRRSDHAREQRLRLEEPLLLLVGRARLLRDYLRNWDGRTPFAYEAIAKDLAEVPAVEILARDERLGLRALALVPLVTSIEADRRGLYRHTSREQVGEDPWEDFRAAKIEELEAILRDLESALEQP